MAVTSKYGTVQPKATAKAASRNPKILKGAPWKVDVRSIEKAASLRKAKERLLRIEEMRDAWHLDLAGKTQREIADALHTTQPRVHRMLKAMEGRPVDTETPEEIILRGVVRDIDRKVMIRRLSEARYTFREHAPEPLDGAIAGSWDQVVAARASGLLSQEEFERVRAAVQPPHA